MMLYGIPSTLIGKLYRISTSKPVISNTFHVKILHEKHFWVTYWGNGLRVGAEYSTFIVLYLHLGAKELQQKII